MRDLHKVVEFARGGRGGAGRRLLLGHSMGGLFALSLLLDRPQAAEGAVVSGPALNSGRGGSPIRLALLRAVSLLLPARTFDHGFDAGEICSDPEVVEAYVGDPLVHRRLSARLAISIVDEGARLRAAAEEFERSVSLLCLHGEEDTVAHPGDTVDFGNRFAGDKAEVQILPGMRHEVFNEMEKDRVFGAVDRFFGLARG